MTEYETIEQAYKNGYEQAKKDMTETVKVKMFKDKCKCEHIVFPHMNYCDKCGRRLEWSK